MYCARRRPRGLSLILGVAAGSPGNLNLLIMETQSYFEDQAPLREMLSSQEYTAGDIQG